MIHTRKSFGGVNYFLNREFPQKGAAVQLARRYRARGLSARVVYNEGKYQVFIRSR